MRRSFIATALAAAIAVAGLASTATQARAGDDYAKIIIGATALAIIGTAIASSHGHKHRYKPGYHHKPYVTRNFGYAPRYYPPPRYGYRAGYRHGYHAGSRHGGGYGGSHYSYR